LASPYWGAHPRYDIRFFSYGERADSSLSAWGRADPQIVEEFAHSGGAFVHYGWPVTVLGEPVVAWTAADGTGVFVYFRPGGDS
jgi:hypothetical protein